MASQTVVELYDDLDGGHADETVSFGLDGVDYVIDLSTANADTLRRVLAGFIPHARRVSGRSKRAAAAEPAPPPPEPTPPPAPPSDFRDRRRTEREVRMAKAESASVTEEIRRLASESANRAAKATEKRELEKRAAQQRAAAARASDEGALFAVADPTPVVASQPAAAASAGPVPALMIPFQEAGL